MTMSAPPFTVRVLHQGSQNNNFASRADPGLLLPATSRLKDDIVTPQSDPEFLEKDLLVDRLNDVHGWLWLCGRPMPPRPLHHQRLVSRNIFITEAVDLHLVWWRDRIFIKPLPPYLLDLDFWNNTIIRTADTQHQDTFPRNLEACARGFLFSYTALIAYKSDFRIAKELGLLPEEVTWEGWKALTAEFLDRHRYDQVNPRYWYGELRLGRLNKIYRFRMGYLLRGYSKVASHAFYGDLLRDHFSVLAAILGYVVVALSAMQVGQGVDKLYEDDAFQSVTYGFTVFSLLAPLIGAVFIVFAVLIMFVSNWRATKVYEMRRFKKMQVEPF
ncbi:hypothetical protein EDB81DRAFT_636134 [Dactylonectria macrodidyma]|uniref:Uncharacterized protein n=1 Tax=Dactylonectria macrodidyma TaxID=307937 RepID=A0A9P9FPJ4_9HYPO|nr:hypothetical protein EDB81DRAFT_636134 [Dactylonectria macrodidyma]